jgi:hypothetical protein
MSKRMPKWLEDAIECDRRPKPIEPCGPEVYPGDIWVVEAAGRAELRRHILVVDVDASCGLLHVCLMSNQTSLAGDEDIVLPVTLTGAPYELMVETQLHTKILLTQATQPVGAVDDDLLDAILDFIWDDRPEQLEHLRGLPSRAKTSARIDFEREEMSDLETLTGADSPTGSPDLEVYVDRSVFTQPPGDPLDMSATSAALGLWRQLRNGEIGCCDVDVVPWPVPLKGIDAGIMAAILQTFATNLLSEDCHVHLMHTNTEGGPTPVLLRGPAQHPISTGRTTPSAIQLIAANLSSQASRSGVDATGRALGDLDDGTTVFAAGAGIYA